MPLYPWKPPLDYPSRWKSFFPFQECLDERQLRALEEYQRSLQERKCEELQRKFERVWKEQEEEQVTQQLSLLFNFL